MSVSTRNRNTETFTWTTRLLLTSIHQRRKQRFTATYSRGTGDVLVPLPPNTKSGTVTAANGFEFLPATAKFVVEGPADQFPTQCVADVDVGHS